MGTVGGNMVIGSCNKLLAFPANLMPFSFFFKRADSVSDSFAIIGGSAAYRTTVLDEVSGFDDKIVTENIECRYLF